MYKNNNIIMDKSSIELTVEEAVDEMMCMDESDSLFSSSEAIEYATEIFKKKLIGYYNQIMKKIKWILDVIGLLLAGVIIICHIEYNYYKNKQKT